MQMQPKHRQYRPTGRRFRRGFIMSMDTGTSILALVLILGLASAVLYQPLNNFVSRFLFNLELESAVRAVRQTYGTMGNCQYGTASITATTLANKGGLSSGAVSGGNLNNWFGGVFAWQGNTCTAYVRADNLPMHVCLAIVQGQKAGGTITSVAAAADMASVASATKQTIGTTPISDTTAATMCSSATNAIEVQTR